MVPSAASAYRRHDSGFSSLDKNDSLSDFRDSVQETEIGVSGIITTCDVGAARTELPVHVVDACTCAFCFRHMPEANDNNGSE